MRSDNRAAQLRKSPSASQHFRRDMALSASESIRPAIEKTTSSSIVCFGAKEIRHYQGFTEDDEIFIEQVKELLLDGALPRPTTKKVAEALKKESDPLFCSPVGSTVDQARKVFLKYISDHPERLHESSKVVVTLALTAAFRCTN